MLKLKFEEFYKYKEMLDFLFEAKEQYGQFINLTNLAETPEGRAIYLAEITDFRTGPAESKGAYYIQACVHAQEGFVLDCMRENTTKIRNIKQYLRAVLFNAPTTIDSYYTALVAHDMASGKI